MKTLGQIAFEAYAKVMEGKTYDGKPIPGWFEVSGNVRFGWEAAALAVRAELNKKAGELFDELTRKYLDNKGGETQTK